MATGSFSGSTQLTGAGAVTAQCSLWLASRTWPGGTPPAQGAAAPTGAADFGPVASGTAFGGPGAFTIASVTEGDYYLLVVFSGTNYWSGPYSVIENTDVVHQSGNETIAGTKTFTGTLVLGKGTAATTQTAGGATQNTLDDGSGNTTIAGVLHADSASTTHPNLQFDTVAGGALSLGTNYGIDLDSNSAIAINAKSGANGGVYTMRGGTKSVTVDDGSGGTSTGALTVSGTFTYTGGTMSLPNGVIPSAAVVGGATSGAAVDVGSTQTITGPKTFTNDLTALGGKVQGNQIGSPGPPTITNVGTTGSTVALYKVVATTQDGRDSIPSDAGSTSTGNATLNGTNYNTITWSAVTGAASYTVLKWNGTAWQKLASGVTGTSYNDQGGALTAYSVASVSPGGEVSAQTVTTTGDISVNGGKFIGTAASTPPTPTVTPTGGTGATAYSYAVVGVTADGRDTKESTVGSTSTGVAFGSLTQSVYNLVQWSAMSNVAGIRVIRTAGGTSQGQITTTLLPPTATSFKDTGLAASGYSAATSNPGGEAYFTNYTGIVVPFAGSTAPTNWLLCDGSAVSRTTFASLFALVGTTYGAGDGSTTFNVPDLRGRTVHGVGSVGSNSQPTLALASTGGEQNHTLTSTEMPSHQHRQAASISSTGNNNVASGGVNGTIDSLGSTTVNTQLTGGGGAHNTMAPYIALNYIIHT